MRQPEDSYGLWTLVTRKSSGPRPKKSVSKIEPKVKPTKDSLDLDRDNLSSADS